MATRLQYRTDLTNKIVAIEDSGYGDFEFSSTELDTYLALTVARLFPFAYKRLVLSAQATTAYGKNGFAYATFTAGPVERVFMVEDPEELEPIRQWRHSGTRLVAIDETFSLVNLHYYDAYTLPADDVTDAGIPASYTPLVVLGGLIEAMESRQDMGVRPDPPSAFPQTNLLDRLQRRWDALLSELGMALPSMVN